MSSIFVKGISGNSFVFSSKDFEDYCDLFKLVHEKDRPKTRLTDYARAVTLNARGRRINLNDPVDPSISSFTMILKSWTMGGNFDDTTLTAECPITLETSKDPTNCHSCMMIFERSSFNKLKNCPCCRQLIQ